MNTQALIRIHIPNFQEFKISINVVLRDSSADCCIGMLLFGIVSWVRDVAELVSTCLAQVTFKLLHCVSAHISILVGISILAEIFSLTRKRTHVALAHTAFGAGRIVLAPV